MPKIHVPSTCSPYLTDKLQIKSTINATILLIAERAIVKSENPLRRNYSDIPIVVSLAVKFGVPGVARVRKQDAADGAAEAALVPASVRHPHKVPVVDLLAAALAHFVSFFAFY